MYRETYYQQASQCSEPYSGWALSGYSRIEEQKAPSPSYI